MNSLTVCTALAAFIVASRGYPLINNNMMVVHDLEGISDMVADNPYFAQTHGYNTLSHFPFDQGFNTVNVQRFNFVNNQALNRLNNQGFNQRFNFVNNPALNKLNNQGINGLKQVNQGLNRPNNHLNHGSNAYTYLLNGEIEHPEYNYQYIY